MSQTQSNRDKSSRNRKNEPKETKTHKGSHRSVSSESSRPSQKKGQTTKPPPPPRDTNAFTFEFYEALQQALSHNVSKNVLTDEILDATLNTIAASVHDAAVKTIPAAVLEATLRALPAVTMEATVQSLSAAIAKSLTDAPAARKPRGERHLKTLYEDDNDDDNRFDDDDDDSHEEKEEEEKDFLSDEISETSERKRKKKKLENAKEKTKKENQPTRRESRKENPENELQETPANNSPRKSRSTKDAKPSSRPDHSPDSRASESEQKRDKAYSSRDAKNQKIRQSVTRGEPKQPETDSDKTMTSPDHSEVEEDSDDNSTVKNRRNFKRNSQLEKPDGLKTSDKRRRESTSIISDSGKVSIATAMERELHFERDDEEIVETMLRQLIKRERKREMVLLLHNQVKTGRDGKRRFAEGDFVETKQVNGRQAVLFYRDKEEEKKYIHSTRWRRTAQVHSFINDLRNEQHAAKLSAAIRAGLEERDIPWWGIYVVHRSCPCTIGRTEGADQLHNTDEIFVSCKYMDVWVLLR